MVEMATELCDALSLLFLGIEFAHEEVDIISKGRHTRCGYKYGLALVPGRDALITPLPQLFEQLQKYHQN